MKTTIEKPKTKEEINKALADLGFSLECSQPFPHVSEDWVAIGYNVNLSLNDKSCFKGVYKMGTGHVKIPKNISTFALQLTSEEVNLFWHWQRNPLARFTNKNVHASVAAKVAKVQKVAPCLADIVSCALLDSEATINRLSFEDWASELGYDSDSIKHRAIYDHCHATGCLFCRVVSDSMIETLRELLQDY